MKIVLSTGETFFGFGPGRTAVGELIFNTSMVGYQEILSDPSYAGQIVVMTYPLMGQYGMTDDDYESKTVGPEAIVTREICSTPSNFRSTRTLEEFLCEKGIASLEGVDTRALTALIRDNAPLEAAIVPEDTPVEEALRLIASRPRPEDAVERVSCSTRWFSRTPNHTYDVVIVDCGLKKSIVTELNSRGCNVTVVPCKASASDILAFKPDGLLLSSGPGNPRKLGDIVQTVNELKGKLPICGIGLGHQIIALSYGAEIISLGCGHHGEHPVRDLQSGRIFTAEHNHVGSVDRASLKGTPLSVTFEDVVDGTIEGLECSKDLVYSCEFTPEGCPGPQESEFFGKFIKLMEESRNA